METHPSADASVSQANLRLVGGHIVKGRVALEGALQSHQRDLQTRQGLLRPSLRITWIIQSQHSFFEAELFRQLDGFGGRPPPLARQALRVRNQQSVRFRTV